MIAEYFGKIFLANINENKVLLLTHDKNKALEGFEPKRDYYKKVINLNDLNLKFLYDIHFFVKYIDSIEKENLWLVDEERAVGLRCDIQKNEVIIDVLHDAKDTSWTEYDKGAACKIINLESCTNFIVERKFIKYDGKIVDKYVRKESVKLSDFKKSILTYKKLNNY